MSYRAMHVELPEEDTDLTPDRPFNPWRVPASPAVEQLIQDVLNQVRNYETLYQLRKRKRKQADQVSFEKAVSAVVCDLIHQHLNQPEGRVFITRSHTRLGTRSRYRPAIYSKALPAILDVLASPELCFIEQSLGYEGFFGPSQQTTLRAGKRLISRIESAAIGLDAIGLSEEQETICLRDTRDSLWDEGAMLEYEDTPVTSGYRDQMRTINRWLRQADLDFDDLYAGEGKVVDVSNRMLRRIFTQGSFESGGRLFGGFWQMLGREERRLGLHINGEQSVELDYGQATPRIAYGVLETVLPMEDAYSIPGFESHRAGMKKVLNAMLFADKPLARMPKGVRKEFSAQHSISEVVSAIEAAHAGLKELFYTGIGHKLQFMESQIMVDVLVRLMSEGVVALPIHDAILVPVSSKELGLRVMDTVFQDHTGIVSKISVKE